jgi:tol-pal system protein YbgF
MMGKRLHTAAVFSLTCLLCACGPGNTLRTPSSGSDDFRLKGVESSLEKTQDELKELKRQQGQSEATLARLQRQVGALASALRAKGLPVAGTEPQGSALGVGFAHPGATVGAETPPAPAAESAQPPQVAQPPEPTDASRTAPPATPPAAQSAGPEAAHGIPMPASAARGAEALPTAVRPQPAPVSSKDRRAMGRVAPATPEAAIAADRAATPPAPSAPPATAAPASSETAAPPAPAETPSAAAKADAAKGGRPGSSAEAASPAEKEEYNLALQQAINGNAKAAKAAFESFAAAHPTSPLAPSALYWVGESAYAAGDYKTATTDFEKVAKGWPGHGKAADALYKMAMAQEKAGDMPAARATLERYLKDYPDAELASVVRQKLQTLPK